MKKTSARHKLSSTSRTVLSWLPKFSERLDKIQSDSTSLDLSECHLTSDATVVILEILEQYPNITDVDLSKNNFYSNEASGVTRSINDRFISRITDSMKNVESLDISSSSVTAEGIAMLAGLPKLKTLKLNNVDLDERAVKALRKIKTITYLEAKEGDAFHSAKQELNLLLRTISSENKRAKISDGLGDTIKDVIINALALDNSQYKKAENIANDLAMMATGYDGNEALYKTGRADAFKQKFLKSITTKIQSAFSDDLHNIASHDLPDSASIETIGKAETKLLDSIITDIFDAAFPRKEKIVRMSR